MDTDGTDPVGEIARIVASLHVRDLVQVYDVDYDVPFRHGLVSGVLQLKQAFRPVPGAGAGRLARRVGAYWCEIVRADVELDLRHGLALVDESRGDAARLADLLDPSDEDRFPAYAAARWNDGAGRILYRSGSHARGRMHFTTALELAERHDLWWCLPDLRSNVLRARLEEARQAAPEVMAQRTAAVIADMLAEAACCERTADEQGVPRDGTALPLDRRWREFLRGYSNVLHNLSFALHHDKQPVGALGRSRRSLAVSDALGDSYRQAQSLNHQAILVGAHHVALHRDPAESDELYRRVLHLRWARGRRIAQQQLARRRGGFEGAQELAALLAELAEEAAATGGAAGLDIDLRSFTVACYQGVAATLPDTEEGRTARADAAGRELEMARSVRQVIALPAYKRAYGGAVRPVYARRIAHLVGELAAGLGDREHHEEIFSLVEESSGRELLDLMSTAALPQLDLTEGESGPAADGGSGEGSADRTAPGEAPAAQAAPAGLDRRGAETPDVVTADPETAVVGIDDAAADDAEVGGTRGGRRGGLRRAADPVAVEADRVALMERESRFEEQFLRRPLEAAPHDPDVARRAEMFVINHPGTALVRYFTYGQGAGQTLAAFVIRDGLRRPVVCGPYAPVQELIGELASVRSPREEHSRRIWRLLIEPLWAELGDPARLDHLVVVPTDGLFSVPFHIASPDGYAEGSLPLGAQVPLSLSVSVTAFVTRGRYLLRRQRVGAGDDLAAMVVDDPVISGRELVGTGWPEHRMLVAGRLPKGLGVDVRRHEADWDGLAAAVRLRPEFFVYAGHGRYLAEYGELGPFLQINDRQGRPDRLTPFDVALRLRLTGNRLTVLGACLAGQGAQTSGGDVVGFVRSFIAAGAGALALPLWRVLDYAMAETGRHLLAQSRVAAAGDGVFDVVRALHEHYRATAADGDWIEFMPLALYT
ncbi:CHAT domain-containing protein [Catellatospora sp. NPDC049609]|uniref:CHAT domain-containing protein n=1 Tax=Catellatospora sp. NPDC049609 TaxID=3155505 RepID=UPI00342C377B